jgi:hypothetical protein
MKRVVADGPILHFRTIPGEQDGGTGFSLWPTGAGERPLLGPFHQTGSDRIALDVSPDLIELLGVTDPVVEGFVLPERKTGASEQSISLARRLAFHGSGDVSQFDPRGQQQVNVVGHDYERVQLIPAIGSSENIRQNALGDFGEAQPLWPVRGSIQQQIAIGKRAPVAGEALEGGERTGQAPGHEYGRSRRVPMREIASIHFMKEVGQMGDFLPLGAKHRLKPVPPSCQSLPVCASPEVSKMYKLHPRLKSRVPSFVK